MANKSNGEWIPGTITPPSNYPNPVDNSVAMHALDWAYGNGNLLVGADTVAPSAPSNVASSNVATTTADLAWDASADFRGVTAYKVYNSSGNTVLATVTTNSASLTGLTASTAYTVYVTALDAAGNESAHSATATFTTTA